MLELNWMRTADAILVWQQSPTWFWNVDFTPPRSVETHSWHELHPPSPHNCSQPPLNNLFPTFVLLYLSAWHHLVHSTYCYNRLHCNHWSLCKANTDPSQCSFLCKIPHVSIVWGHTPCCDGPGESLTAVYCWRGGVCPVKGEGRGYKFIVLKVGYSQTKPVPITLIPLSHGSVKVGSNDIS